MSDVNPALVADAPFYSQEYGEFLSSKAARMQQVLHDYNPYLELVFIPRSKRDDTDTHPFAIRDTSPWRGGGYIVRHITEREMENPEAILAWLFEGDLSKHTADELWARNEAKKAAEDLMRMKREQDIAEERQDLVAALVSGGRNRLNSFRHNGKIFTGEGARSVSTAVH